MYLIEHVCKEVSTLIFLKNVLMTICYGRVVTFINKIFAYGKHFSNTHNFVGFLLSKYLIENNHFYFNNKTYLIKDSMKSW